METMLLFKVTLQSFKILHQEQKSKQIIGSKVLLPTQKYQMTFHTSKSIHTCWVLAHYCAL